MKKTMVIEWIATFVIILAGVWFLTEVLQATWYETVVTNLVPRLLLASVILTSVQVAVHLRIENLLDDGLPFLIGSGILWVGCFWAILQFATSHALGLGLAGMLLLTSLSGLASDGLQGVGRSARINTSKPARKSVRTPRYNSAVMPFQQPAAPSKEVDPKPEPAPGQTKPK